MRYVSTADRAHTATFREAVLRGTPPGGGLYVPETLPTLPADMLARLGSASLREVATALGRAFVGRESLADDALEAAVDAALEVPLPFVQLEEGLRVLELFHGPTLAFKDVGARFLASALGQMGRADGRELVVLTATSGDTGGAVAAGFHGVPGVSVVVLYPAGRVSALQERQFAALGGNVHAVRVAGSFDDCQRLAKAMFADDALRGRVALTSANSISVGRLVPQTFYHAEIARQAASEGEAPPAVVVPSGNVGNLTAGVWARRAGLPLGRFVAATNANRAFAEALASGEPLADAASVATLSTAMDVGAPSNAPRFFGAAAGVPVEGAWVSDAETADAMRAWAARGYVACPHTAVGLRAWERVRRPGEAGVVLATAHPAKFEATVADVLGAPPEIPERLARLAALPLRADDLAPEPEALRDWLLARFG